MSCLRPAPPTRSYLSQPGDPTGGAKRSSGSTKKGNVNRLFFVVHMEKVKLKIFTLVIIIAMIIIFF